MCFFYLKQIKAVAFYFIVYNTVYDQIFKDIQKFFTLNDKILHNQEVENFAGKRFKLIITIAYTMHVSAHTIDKMKIRGELFKSWNIII